LSPRRMPPTPQSGAASGAGDDFVLCGLYRIDVLMNSVNNENPIASFRYGLYAVRGLEIDYVSAGKREVKMMAKQSSSRAMKKSSAPMRAYATSTSDDSGASALTTLNFKVSQDFHREFKTFAAQHSKKMVEVLQEAFALLKDANGR
jgi:hypothetical protein